MLGSAVLLGVASWWYRFEAAHRSTEFWGTSGAEAIARPAEVLGLVLGDPATAAAEDSAPASSSVLNVQSQRYPILEKRDLSQARGIRHMDSLLLADQNFRWDTDPPPPHWARALEFVGETSQTTVLFSADLNCIGKLDPTTGKLQVLECQPLRPALQEYFARPDVFGASSEAE
jgi:hypothetical protein